MTATPCVQPALRGSDTPAMQKTPGDAQVTNSFQDVDSEGLT